MTVEITEKIHVTLKKKILFKVKEFIKKKAFDSLKD